ncbi:MAG: DNA primase [Lacticaseibacillus songhuajiangensis]|nr:DNA primase [Lacticaseibacillus songhuajiangensis]
MVNTDCEVTVVARIPEDKITEIKNAVNIADYVGQTVQLKKQGKNLFGLCPFHDENTPSFTVNEEKQIFSCFSCHRAGNVFKFVEELDKLNFPEAVKKVADYAGIQLDVQSNTYSRPENPRLQRQKQILKMCEDFMHHLLLNTESGSAALKYVEGRGMSAAVIDHFGIGYAPDDAKLMGTFLRQQQVTDDEMRASGMFSERDNGQLNGRFVNRVMFPLRNERGETVGFSGRRMSDQQNAKYLNSPETELFNKSQLLFNLDEARSHARSGEPVYLFEGFMDVISAYSAGVHSGVASMGTALTSQQIQIIERTGKQLVVCYDGDQPGQDATQRALSLLRGSSLTVSAVILPGGVDPDEFIKQKGAEAFQKQLQSVLTPTAFSLRYLAAGVDMANDHAKLTYINSALQQIQSVTDGVERALYMQQLADQTGMPQDVLQAELDKMPQQTQSASTSSTGGDQYFPPEPPADAYAQDYGAAQYGPEPAWPEQDTQAPSDYATGVSPSGRVDRRLSRLQLAERDLLAYMLTDAETTLAVAAEPHEWGDDDLGALISEWLQYVQAHEPVIGTEPDYEDFLARQTGDRATLISTCLSVTLPPVETETVQNLLAVIDEGLLKEQLTKIKMALKDAKRLGDGQRQLELSTKYFNLMRRVQAQR